MKFFSKRKSTLEACRSILPRSELKKILSEVTDEREILYTIAELKNTSEATLRKEIARKCNILVLDSVPEFDVSLLPQHMTLAPLWKHGVVPLFNRGKIIGVACIDPRSVVKVDASWDLLPLYLSSWHELKKALKTSEDLEITSDLHTDSTCEEILSLILAENFSFKGGPITFQFSSHECEYRFSTSHGKEASGRVDPCVKDYFRSFLNTKKDSLLRVNNQGVVVQKHSDEIFIIEKRVDRSSKVIPFPLLQSSQNDALDPKSVVLIDDDPDFIKIMERFFLRSCLPFYSFTSVHSALIFLRKASAPGVILSDVHMPEKNGVDLLHTLTSDDALRRIPVISLSADDAPETHLMLLKNGASLVLSKRVDSQILLQYVKNFVAPIKESLHCAHS